MKHLVAMFLVAFLPTSAVVLSWSEYFMVCIMAIRVMNSKIISRNNLLVPIIPGKFQKMKVLSHLQNLGCFIHIAKQFTKQ